MVLFNFSCKKFLEIAPPKSSSVQETIFTTDDVATSAITGIYRSMALTSNSFASGGFSSVGSVAGCSADELIGYNPILVEFYENQLTPSNSYVSGPLYSVPYKCIYTANAVLEGLSAPNGVTPPVKAQLEGEALFIRAFSYFYLINLFGGVPLQLTTDYRVTQVLPRAQVSQIYEQIVTDLERAENLLTETYVTTERIRPNKSAAQAMLARVYLYMQNWEKAEKYASLVIGKTGTYNLVGFDAVFLKNSNEAIWQLMPTANSNSGDGNLFVLVATPIYVSLRKDFVESAFEAGDKRKSSWVQTYTNATGTYYYPFKYKIRSSTSITEYSMVLRLAEQYLIRAEARINQDKIELGIRDLNLVRLRTLPNGTNSNPLPGIPATLNKGDALLAVEKERRIELFAEWGHRWFDLKRTKRVNDILNVVKSKWQNTDVLYPIPATELNLNPRIIPNDGY